MLNMESILTIIAVVFLFVEIIGILAAFHAVMNTKTSQGAIAWGISLVTFPWLALPLYAVFGRSKFHGYVLLRHVKEEKIHHIIDQCSIDATEKQIVQQHNSKIGAALTRLADLPITRFNRSRLLIDGKETFQSIFNSIDAANEYILIEFFIIKDDRLGRELKNRLIHKAQGKVRVYFLYDEIGSHKLPESYIREMEREGIVTSAFQTTQGRTNRFQLNFRNHRKIVVVDGLCAFVGGHNVGDEYVSGHPKLGSWRDTHVKVEGPVVQAIQYCFLEDWYWATSEVPDLDWQFQKAQGGAENTLLIPSGPADDLETCGLMFTLAINSALERIWIASPYFVPDQQIIGALKLAALRGVDVRILLPDKPDHRTVYLASYSFYPNTLPVGIKLYRYKPGFLHQKVFLVDSACAAVGTANLDNRSFRLNFELTLLNFNQTFINDVEAMLKQDFSESRLVTLEDYTRRGFLFKAAVRLASLLSPIL
ncbi:MAG: cardiolipin synthase [Desulfobacterales bacterium]|jgi:cardiolipin synthase